MSTSAARRKQLEAWDTVASSMPDFSSAPSTAYYRAREIDLIRRAVGSLEGKRVLKLDLWNEAINTRILAWMHAEGANAFGLDLSHVVAHRARRNATVENFDVSIIRADIRELPYLDETFDVVYTMGTIEHIDEYGHAIREVHRVLRAGGTAIIGVPNFWDPFLRPLIVAVLELFGKYPYAPERSFTWAELRREAGSGEKERSHRREYDRSLSHRRPRATQSARDAFLGQRIATYDALRLAGRQRDEPVVYLLDEENAAYYCPARCLGEQYGPYRYALVKPCSMIPYASPRSYADSERTSSSANASAQSPRSSVAARSGCSIEASVPRHSGSCGNWSTS